jgi:tetratricopeptide (TPR) repeat protein
MSGAYQALGWLHYDLFDWETAEEYLKRALQLAKDVDSQFFILTSSGILALVQTQSGDLPAGHASLEGVFSQETPMIAMGQRQCWAAMAELAIAEKNLSYALQIVEKLKSTAASMPSNGVISIIWYLEARFLLADGRPIEAENLLFSAIRNAKQFGEKSLLWRLYGCLGQAYKDQAKRMESNAALLKAQEIVEEIVDTIPEEELQAKFLRRTNKILFMEGHV